MMKKGIFRLLTVLTACGICISQAQAEEIQSAGNMHFLGQVVNAPCVIDMHSLHQVVVLGQVKDADLRTTGQWAGATAFQIRLEDCDTSVRESASAAFNGTPDAHDPQVFKTGDGSDPAKDVGLGIFDSKGNLLIPNSTPLTFEALTDGVTILHYLAKYRATSDEVTPGDASAAVSFSVLYQ